METGDITIIQNIDVAAPYTRIPMPHVRTKAPNGDGVVIVPEANYDCMIEKLEDFRDSEIAERSRREIESGAKELLTHAEVKEMLAARTPLAFWGKKRGMTQAALAKTTGVAQGCLSEIEAGQKPGTAATLKKIAYALQLTVDDLIWSTPAFHCRFGVGDIL